MTRKADQWGKLPNGLHFFRGLASGLPRFIVSDNMKRLKETIALIKQGKV